MSSLIIKDNKKTEIQNYLESLNSNKDISNQKINNKLKNLNFITKYNVFSHIINFVGATTDNSKAYIPIKYNKASIINSDGKSEIFEFLSPNESNNYADLIIKNGFINFNFKTVRVKSLSAIPMDGSHITWDICGINNTNYLVFYSTNPNDMGKIVIMTTKTYVETFVKNNNKINAYYLNGYNIDVYKTKLHLSDNNISLIDYSQDVVVPKDAITNINIKYHACYKTVMELNKNPLSMMNRKTHFGKKYTVYNFKSGNILVFRDCYARNNFFTWNTKIKLADNHNINRNCKNQDLLVNGDDVDKLRMNIFEDDGWIIMNYIPNIEKIKEYVQTLLHKLVAFSVTWKNRLQHLLKSIDNVLEKFNNIIKKFNEYMNKQINYFRPLHLLNYITCTNNVDMYNYYNKHLYMKKFF